MTILPTTPGLILAAVLFALGLAGVLARRNLLFLLFSIEIMLNAAGLALVIAGAGRTGGESQAMFLFVLAVTAAEVAVGLALVLRIHHRTRSIDADDVRDLGGDR